MDVDLPIILHNVHTMTELRMIDALSAVMAVRRADER